MKLLAPALGIFLILVLAGCVAPRGGYDEFEETRDFAVQCHNRAHEPAMIRFARRETYVATNVVLQEVRPVLHADRALVRAAEQLFLDAYQSLPPEERAWVAPCLVTFGTTGTWAVAKHEVTSAVYAVRSALVEELLHQLWFGITGAVERVPTPEPPLLVWGLGWNDQRAADAEWSSDEIPAVLAERLLNDTEVHTFQVTDRHPLLPFITSHGTYSVTICGQIAAGVAGPGPCDPRLRAALDQIRTRPDHPAYAP